MEFDFSQITGILIEALTVILMAGVTWAVRTFQSKTKSDELKVVMDRLGDTVKNGISYGLMQGQEAIQGKLRVNKSKSAIVNLAIDYVLTNSPELIAKSGYSSDKLRRWIEGKLPQVASEITSSPETVEEIQAKLGTME